MSVKTDTTFEILMREHHRRVMAYAVSLVRDEHVAKDLVQDAFVVAYKRLATFDPARDFGNWVRGMVRLKYLEWCREHKEIPLEDSVLNAVGEQYQQWDAASRDGRGEALDKLRECMAGLEGLARQSVTLFYMDRRPCEEIAAMMRTTETAVRKRLERVRRVLFDCVKQKMGAEGAAAVVD